MFIALLYTTIGTNFLGYLKNLTTLYLITRQIKKGSKAIISYAIVNSVRQP